MNTYFAVFFFTVRGFECPTCFKRFPIEEIEEHADLCASHIIEFGDDTCPGEARAVARTLIGGVYIHIFRFCPTSFF